MSIGDGMQERFAAVLAETDAEQAAGAMAVAAAVYAGVTLADRFRAAHGIPVRVVTTAATDGGEEPSGWVAQVAADAVLIESAAAPTRWVIPLSSVNTVHGLPAGHRKPASAVERLGLGHLLRPLCGHQVCVACGVNRHHGVLRRVGADHLELGGSREVLVIASTIVSWVRI